jgi:hypothetical protein
MMASFAALNLSSNGSSVFLVSEYRRRLVASAVKIPQAETSRRKEIVIKRKRILDEVVRRPCVMRACAAARNTHRWIPSKPIFTQANVWLYNSAVPAFDNKSTSSGVMVAFKAKAEDLKIRVVIRSRIYS